MRRLRIPAVILAAALIIIVSFFLPTYVSAVRDGRTVGILSASEGTSGGFKSAPKLTVPERLSLVTKAGNIALDNGRNLDWDTAYQSALTELKLFNAGGVMDFDFEHCRLLKFSTAFYIDSAEPAKSLIVWDILIEDESSHAASVFVDDETGKLLAISYTYLMDMMEYREKMEIVEERRYMYAVDADALVDAVTAYYGLYTATADSDRYDYDAMILLSMSDGETSAEVGVNVSVDGFWFNI